MIFDILALKRLRKKNLITVSNNLQALKAIILLIFIVHSPLSSFAQGERSTGTIFGIITDRVSSTPLFGASVNIVDTNKGAMADDEGEYKIVQVPPGIYNLRFSMVDIKP